LPVGAGAWVGVDSESGTGVWRRRWRGARARGAVRGAQEWLEPAAAAAASGGACQAGDPRSEPTTPTAVC